MNSEEDDLDQVDLMDLAVGGSRSDFCKTITENAPTQMSMAGVSTKRLNMLTCLSSFSIYDLICKHKYKLLNNRPRHLAAANSVINNHTLEYKLKEIEFIRISNKKVVLNMMNLNNPISLQKSYIYNSNLQNINQNAINSLYGKDNHLLYYGYTCVESSKNFLTKVAINDIIADNKWKISFH